MNPIHGDHPPKAILKSDQLGESFEVMSGGSTGNPKRLSRSTQSWVHSAEVEAGVFGLGPTDRFVVFGDPNHSLWAYARFRAELMASPFLGLHKPDEGSLDQFCSSEPTVLYGVPELVLSAVRQLARSGKTLRSLRRILLGGGPLPTSAPANLIQSVFPRAETWMFYGSAEASFVGYAGFDQTYQLFPDVELEIRDDQSIWVQSPMTISPSVWINTGDLGRWIEGDRFEILGRASRQLQVKGKKYPAEQMENWLATRLGLDRLALLQNCSSHVWCFYSCTENTSAAESSYPTLAQVNQLIRELDSDFPPVRRLETLDLISWPLTESGKTNWPALANHMDAMP